MRTWHEPSRDRPATGFGLVEAVIVCMVGAIVVAAAVPILTSTLRRTGSDGAAHLLAQELGYARALAVASHNDVVVQVDPQQNSVVVAPGSGSARGPFGLSPGIRLQSAAPVPDTPDSLGATVLGAGNFTQLTFRDNGAAVFDPALNNLASGTFFLEHTDGDPATRRAITVMGGTGRVRVWRYDPQGGSWK